MLLRVATSGSAEILESVAYDSSVIANCTHSPNSGGRMYVVCSPGELILVALIGTGGNGFVAFVVYAAAPDGSMIVVEAADIALTVYETEKYKFCVPGQQRINEIEQAAQAARHGSQHQTPFR
jgi:hypothetical protein